ncbi:Hypothetical predicted protein [Olea europaea subsp. europaea]|uniref:Uncharacterized protein n=1 Tax=Olea europaea subsp. europaea TaxID=158383 RepID=A0A8S0PE39_OLEEU|nr:Hypothetical predicted protein [Olea europaea subsp. europaea]
MGDIRNVLAKLGWRREELGLSEVGCLLWALGRGEGNIVVHGLSLRLREWESGGEGESVVPSLCCDRWWCRACDSMFLYAGDMLFSICDVEHWIIRTDQTNYKVRIQVR